MLNILLFLLQAQIFLLIILITAIFNYFIGSFIPIESKQQLGFFSYDGTTIFFIYFFFIIFFSP